MDDFLIGKKVKITAAFVNEGCIGIIEEIYPNGLFTDKTIYKIRLNEHSSGQYIDTQFELLEE